MIMRKNVTSITCRAAFSDVVDTTRLAGSRLSNRAPIVADMMTAGVGLLVAMGAAILARERHMASKDHIVMRRVASTIIERSIP